MIKIYGAPATSAGRCFWALEEMGVEYEVAEFSFRTGDHKKPAYLAKNPNGKVPVIEDGDFVMWESIAINRYLAAKYAPGLLGETLEVQALVDQWSVWSQVEYQKPLIDLFVQVMFVPEDKRDAAKMDKIREQIAPVNALLNAHLEGREFVVGDTFSVADINLASVARLNGLLKVSLDAYPALDGWLKNMLARPASQKVTAMSRPMRG